MQPTIKYLAFVAALTIGGGALAQGTIVPSSGSGGHGAADTGHGAAAADDHGGSAGRRSRLQANAGHGGTHWSYEGAEGPDAWAGISAEFEACGAGLAQSPIDINVTDGASVQHLDIDYGLTPVNILHNGHTVQVNSEPGSGITVGGKRYELLQFHYFHTPSEHGMQGKRAAMEVHFVHKAADGELAVIGVMLESGGANRALEEIWQHLPSHENPAEVFPDVLVNGRDLLPRDTSYYRYMGSLTTPPCSEVVNWFVMQHSISVGVDQVARFAAAVGNNARPLQALNNRLLLAPVATN